VKGSDFNFSQSQAFFLALLILLVGMGLGGLLIGLQVLASF